MNISTKKHIIRNDYTKFLLIFFAVCMMFASTFIIVAVGHQNDPVTSRQDVFQPYKLRWLQISDILIWITIIYVMTRFFRTATESDAPRPWWMLTNSKFAGWFFGLYFLYLGMPNSDPEVSRLFELLFESIPACIFSGLLIFSALKAPGRTRSKANGLTPENSV